MKPRVLLAGIAGGVVLFVWGVLSHMVLGLGEVGVKLIHNEDAVLTAMRSTIQEPGFYFFPGEGMETGQPTPEQMKRWEEKYSRGPTGVLVYQPGGATPWDPKLFLTELLADIGAALIAACLLSSAVGSLGSLTARTLFVAPLGLFSGLDVHVSYWNWYRFPTDYTLGIMADGIIGWTLVGVVLALLIKPSK
ncbi:MAG TPA: hypothetical protein VLB32_03275 [Candidatus Acidoferrales bacterium]|nr:hypothetical protein [Candidatus Acidoferrales bacterium]